MPFTVITTVILAIALVVSVYTLDKFFKRIDLTFDTKFLVGIFPWLIFSVILRVSVDAGIYPRNFFLHTPGIEILMFLIILPFILVGNYLEKKGKVSLWKFLLIPGLGLMFYFSKNLFVASLVPAYLTYLYLAGSLVFLLLVFFTFDFDLMSTLAIIFHFWDASSTTVAMKYFGYFEKHVFPTFFINLTSEPAIMFVLKGITVIPALILISKYSEDKKFANFLKFIILIFGFTPALRDTLRMVMGV